MGVRPNRVIVTAETRSASRSERQPLARRSRGRPPSSKFRGGPSRWPSSWIDGQTLRSEFRPRRCRRRGIDVAAHLELSYVTWFDTRHGPALWSCIASPPPDAIALNILESASTASGISRKGTMRDVVRHLIDDAWNAAAS